MAIRILVALTFILAFTGGCKTTLTFELEADQPFTLQFTEPEVPA